MVTYMYTYVYHDNVNADVLLPYDGEYLRSVKVVKRVTDDLGNPNWGI